jgi:hypothetical protein
MSETTTDHDTIRKWAESHGGKPAAVDRTHKEGDVGIIRLMFPKSPQSEHGSLVEISWEEFFKEFEERELALIYDEDSLFSKIVGRDTVQRREHGDNHAARPSPERNAGSRGSAGHRSKVADETEARSLKSREYRDAEGNLHHHTNTYMEEHEKQSRGSKR